MEESSTYQLIVARGRAEGAVQEAKKILLRQGRKRFGKPKAQTSEAIEAIADLGQLEELSERLLEASSWEDLLSPAPSRRPNGKRKKTS